jgi:hypothetical protein
MPFVEIQNTIQNISEGRVGYITYEEREIDVMIDGDEIEGTTMRREKRWYIVLYSNPIKDGAITKLCEFQYESFDICLQEYESVRNIIAVPL